MCHAIILSALVILVASIVPQCVSVSAISEAERLLEYNKRGYSWPPKQYEYKPDTPGWRELYEERFSQVQQIESLRDRWQAYVLSVYSGLIAPNFTELGFGLTRAPEDLTAELLQAIQEGLPTAGVEADRYGVEGPDISYFVQRQDLLDKVLHGLKHYVEAWSGVPVVPHQAYGFRLYRNQSFLGMHGDRRQTHVLSFILHIGSSEDAEPWPILIEDFHGNTHEVVLTSGDMLFYESSKCLHGRPGKFNGSWYCSVFSHYYPVTWDAEKYEQETVSRIPSGWADFDEQGLAKNYSKVEMTETAMKHPECPNQWCVTKETVKWSGPGEEGFWIAPDRKRHKLDLSAVPTTTTLSTGTEEL